MVTPSLHPEVPDISVCVAWTQALRHQAIDGLDEGVWYHTIGDLGAKGQRQNLYASLPILTTFGWDGG